jgi:hypothetical protein
MEPVVHVKAARALVIDSVVHGRDGVVIDDDPAGIPYGDTTRSFISSESGIAHPVALDNSPITRDVNSGEISRAGCLAHIVVDDPVTWSACSHASRPKRGRKSAASGFGHLAVADYNSPAVQIPSRVFRSARISSMRCPREVV